MNDDDVWRSFLGRQLEQGMALARSSDVLTLACLPGLLPDRYIARFRCNGLARTPAGEIVEGGPWAIGIRFPEEYLRREVVVPEVLTYLGPVPEPWHPNIRPPFVCLHLTPSMPLVEILYGLHDLLTWSLYATDDEGLNHAASQWARHQDPARFPVDRRPLKRRESPKGGQE